MKKMIFKNLLVLGAVLGFAPVQAAHGPLLGTARDSWIDQSVQALVAAGWVKAPALPLNELSNLQVAQLTAQAAEFRIAQANTQAPDLTAAPPPLSDSIDLPAPQAPSPEASASTPAQAAGTENLQKLVGEFKGELSAMDLDLTKLEDRIFDQEHRSEKFEDLQREYLKKTGTQIYGYSRAYFDTYRGFGSNAIYGAMDYNDIIFADLSLKSVPVPFVLFDMTLRLTRTIGLYYNEPISPDLTLRWLSLSNVNDVANITTGDFTKATLLSLSGTTTFPFTQ